MSTSLNPQPHLFVCVPAPSTSPLVPELSTSPGRWWSWRASSVPSRGIHTLSLSHKFIYTLSLSHTHTFIYLSLKHEFTLALSLARTHSLTLSRSRQRGGRPNRPDVHGRHCARHQRAALPKGASGRRGGRSGAGVPGALLTLHSAPYTLHVTTYTLYPTLYTLHLISNTQHPTPDTSHLTPHTKHPTPHIYTLSPSPYTRRSRTFSPASSMTQASTPW